MRQFFHNFRGQVKKMTGRRSDPPKRMSRIPIRTTGPGDIQQRDQYSRIGAAREAAIVTIRSLRVPYLIFNQTEALVVLPGIVFFTAGPAGYRTAHRSDARDNR